MSATETLRRSARERTQTQVYVSASSQKRKRAESSDDDRDDDLEEEQEEEPSEDENEGDDDDDEVEFPDPRPRKPTTVTKASTSSKRPAAKKPRAAVTPRGSKKNAIDTIAAVKDASISDDNALFNALSNPATALESTVQDFLDSFGATPEAASADLVNCVFRVCGCNSSVDSDQVMDSDGVVDFLGDVVEEIKGTEAQGYPLISKAPVFRKLRKSLSEFFDRLVKAGSETDVLFDSELIPTLQSWVVAMSSAQLRSFRHTATVVALEVESALCTVAATIEKEAETVSRQKEAERKKRKGSGPASEREKALATKASEVKVRKTKMNEFLKDFFDGVFVHRYRDADAGIRADCVREMGIWLKRHPSHFLEGNYLRYVGWVLSDTNTNVRLEAVKSLLSLYSKEDYLITIQHFTERFKPRLIAMATNDTELSVRVAVIQVLGAIDSSSLLEEEQRDTLCVLVFDEEARVRKAISGFVKGIWEETVTARLVGRDEGSDPDSPEVKLAGAKALASLLVGWERALAKRGAEDASESQSQNGESSTSTAAVAHTSETLALLGALQKGRTALAVEALWDEVDAVNDWQTLLDILLLDHSGSGQSAAGADDAAPKSKMRGKKATAASSPVKKRRKGKGAQGKNGNDEDDDMVDEAWRVEEAEESALVEVLLASLEKTLADEATRKGGDLDSVKVDITRALIRVLPQLFTKYQTDPVRMAELLRLPQLMKLDLYLELRMISAYEALWDDVTKQILSQTSPSLLNTSLATLSHMMSTTTLSNTNVAKALELDDELAGALREVVAGQDELDAYTFSTDEIDSLTATLSRLAKLAERRDMTAWIEETDSGKQSSAWEIISALMERGRLGRKEEEALVNNAITILSLHVAWKASKLRAATPVQQDGEDSIESLRKERDYLVEQLADFVSGGQFNTTNSVKRSAFQSLITLHILFAPDPPDSSSRVSGLSALAIEMDDRLQHQCAGFVQAEAEAFTEELQEREAEDSDDANTVRGSDSDQDSETPVKPVYKTKKPVKERKETTAVHRVERARDLASEYAFISVVSYFLRAIAPGAIDARHSAVLLAYHGRLGNQFDHCLSTVIGVLREEGMYKQNGALVEHVATEALRQSFTMFMDGQTDSVAASVGLAKALSPAFSIRGAHLSITQRLASEHVVHIHTSLLTWAIKRIAGYETSGNKKKKTDSIEFFRVLHALLATIDSREAAQIKAHLDKTLEAAKIEVPPTAKAWDAQRLYDKRLLGAMAKDKGLVAKGKAARKKADDGTDDGEADPDATPTKKSSKPKPIPKARAQPTRKSARSSRVSAPEISEEDDRDEDAMDVDQDVFGSQSAKSPARPKAKPKPKFKRKSPTPEAEEEPEPEPSEGAETPAPSSPEPSASERHPTPPSQPPPRMAGRKRARPADDDEDAPEADSHRTPRKFAGRKRAAPEQDDDDEERESLRSSPEEQSSPVKQRSPQKPRQPSPAGSDASLANYTSSRKRVRR